MKETKFRVFASNSLVQNKMYYPGDTVKDVNGSEYFLALNSSGSLLAVYPDGGSCFARIVMSGIEVMQWLGITIRGVELYEGDIVEFTDKWDWYRSKYSVKMMFADKEEHARLMAEFNAEPMYRFVVKQDLFEGLNVSAYDLKEDRYQIIGNVWENQDLVPFP